MFGYDAWVAAVIIMVLFVAAVLSCVYLVWRVGWTVSKHPSDLVTCPHCRRQISREYSTCPQCGHVMASANDASGQLLGKPAPQRPTLDNRR
jgi:predicted amidophosphoribosyltransferase